MISQSYDISSRKSALFCVNRNRGHPNCFQYLEQLPDHFVIKSEDVKIKKNKIKIKIEGVVMSHHFSLNLCFFLLCDK